MQESQRITGHIPPLQGFGKSAVVADDRQAGKGVGRVMIGALSIMAKTPCLISVVNDGNEPDLVVIEPLQVVRIVHGFEGEGFVHSDSSDTVE